MCNREAPEVEQFARQHADALNIVGFGTQDSFEEAEGFRTEHDITFRLLWDPGFDSWQHFGITSQPNAILFDKDGEAIARWQGALDDSNYQDILARIGAA